MPLVEKLEKYDEVITYLKDTTNTIDRDKIIRAIESSKSYEEGNEKLDNAYESLVFNLALVFASILLIHFVLLYEVAYNKKS